MMVSKVKKIEIKIKMPNSTKRKIRRKKIRKRKIEAINKVLEELEEVEG